MVLGAYMEVKVDHWHDRIFIGPYRPTLKKYRVSLLACGNLDYFKGRVNNRLADIKDIW